MKYFGFLLLIFLLLSTNLFAEEKEKKIVGIIEFEEKTSIGQENASVVIPEILIDHLKKVNKYKLVERILLQKVLLEQELQLSGITEQNAAVKIGQIFGLNAFVIGSFMQVSDKITITARIIDTETAEIITTGKVELFHLNQLDNKIEELAYLISGYSEREYKGIKLDNALSLNNFGIRYGMGLNIMPAPFFRILDLETFYQGKYLDIEVTCSAPVQAGIPIASADLGGTVAIFAFTVYPLTHLGFSVCYNVGNTPKFGEQDVIGKEYISHTSFVNTISMGLAYRAFQDLRINLQLGLASLGGSKFTFQDNDNNFAAYEIPVSIFDNLLGPLNLSVEYYIGDLSLKVYIIDFVVNGRKISGTIAKEYKETAMFLKAGLLVGYRFSF